MDDNKKIILILGASSDLGIALIRSLNDQEKRDGVSGRCTVLAHYAHTKDVLNELQDECDALSIRLFQSDLSKSDEVDHLIAQLIEKSLIPTHIVSFAAAAYCYMRLSEWDEAVVRKDMDIQVYALAAVFKAFLPRMAEKRYGKVVVMLSSCTIGEPPHFLSNYTTVKYALLGLVKSAAAEYGGQGLNINGISPAMVDTRFVRGIGRKMRELNAEENPRHRNLNVDDVIPAIRYLLSDEAEFANGTNLNLSGRGA